MSSITSLNQSFKKGNDGREGKKSSLNPIKHKFNSLFGIRNGPNMFS